MAHMTKQSVLPAAGYRRQEGLKDTILELKG
jgi:hypothetical protein